MRQFIHTLRFPQKVILQRLQQRNVMTFAFRIDYFWRNGQPLFLFCKDTQLLIVLFKFTILPRCVPLGESGSGFLICGVPFEKIHFQISDLSNPLWTRIHRFTDLRDLNTDHWITDPTRSFGRRIGH